MQKYRITTNGNKYRVEKRFWRPFPKWLPLDSRGWEAGVKWFSEHDIIPTESTKMFDALSAAIDFQNKIDPPRESKKWWPAIET